MKKVPKLRFPGYDGQWEEKQLGEVVTFLDGKRKPIKDSERKKMEGPYPYYGASGIIDYVNDYIFDEELILLGEDGANILNRSTRLAFLAKGKYWVNNHAHVIKGNNGVNQYFLCEYLENLNYEPYNTGTAQPKLNQEVCKSIKVKLPTFGEQQKIADFFSTLDSRIEIQEEKINNLENQKKGYLQRIFSQEVRFKDKNGEDYPEWEEKKIGEMFDITSSKRVHAKDWESTGVPFYRAREIVSLYAGGKIEPLYIHEKLYKEYSTITGEVKPGDLLVTGVGTIGVPYLVKEGDRFYFKDGNIIWIKNSNGHNGKFLYYLYGSELIKTQLRNMAGIGTVATYTIDSAKNTIIPLPCDDEQQRIANFLSLFDEKIETEKKILKTLRKMKAALLQKMFM